MNDRIKNYERSCLTDKKRNSFYIVDGTAIAYRSYFAFIKNPLINSRGLNTGAIYGFTTVLMKLLRETKPDFLACVFDSKEPTFRHKKFKEYKATREKMPDDMIEQLPYIERIVKGFNVPYLIYPTVEADDIIATLVDKNSEKDLNIFIVSGDKDLMQLVSERIKLFTPKKGGDSEIIDTDAVIKKFGVPPRKMIDLLSLMGDSSDNIPGVPGIGEKTALKLIQQFGTLDDILSNPDKIESKKISDSIKANKNLALLSRELIELEKNVPINNRVEDFKPGKPDEIALSDLFKELEFHSLLEKFEFHEEREERSKKYVTITTNELLDDLIKRLKSSDRFVFDTETTGLNPIDSKLVGISFSFEETEAFYLPFLQAEDDEKSPLHFKNLIEILKPILEDPKISKGGHNLKFDILVMKNCGVDVRGISFDTMIESYLLDPSARQHNLDLVSLKNLNYKKIPTESLIGKGKDQITMDQVEIAKVAEYSCEDSDITMRLHNFFTPKIKEFGLIKLYETVEIPLVKVLASMEWEGVKIDVELLKKLSEDVEKKLNQIQKEIVNEAGEEFNINSPKQLGNILFEKLKINQVLGIKRVKKTKTGYSTDSAVLESLSAHPIVNKILEYRNLSKLRSTYLDALPEIVNSKTGRVHTSFNQTITATGRLSSSNPNLQNIPIRTDEGKKIRRAFIPREKNWSIVSADYSQIELRILAHLSKDENFINAFKEGADVHRRTAATIFGVDDDKVDAELRFRAKAINFGIIYGMGPQRLARDTKISFEEAQNFINSYFENYPGIRKFIDEQIKFARDNGFVLTLLGRRRAIPDILSNNPGLKINAEHIAVNTPIQGSAADLIKIAMINIQNRIASKNLSSKMILQVHDELVFEAPDDEIIELEKIVTKEMEEAIKLDVPIRVDIKHGKSWYETH